MSTSSDLQHPLQKHGILGCTYEPSGRVESWNRTNDNLTLKTPCELLYSHSILMFTDVSLH
ncbi:hypothetical protein STEG23_006280, partial [Scotinomys teguina]